MAFLGTLLNIGKGLIGLGGGGNAGEIASKVAGILGNVGPVASGAAKGAQDTRQQDTTNQLLLQQLLQQNANNANTGQMDRAKFAAGERDAATKRSITGGLLGGLQDVNIDRPAGSTIPNFNVTGGMRPSALGPEARAAIMQQLSAGPMEAPAYKGVDDLTLPQAGTGEKLLGGVGLAGSLLGGIGQFLGKQAPQESKAPVDLSQPNPLIFSKKPYQGLFAPTGGMA